VGEDRMNYALIHKDGCGQVCFYRSTKPEIYTPLDEKDTFNIDGSPTERSQQVMCQSCNKPLCLYEVHPDYWEKV